MNTALSGSGRVDDIQGHPQGEIRGETKLVKITEDVRMYAAEPLFRSLIVDALSPASRRIHPRGQPDRQSPFPTPLPVLLEKGNPGGWKNCDLRRVIGLTRA